MIIGGLGGSPGRRVKAMQYQGNIYGRLIYMHREGRGVTWEMGAGVRHAAAIASASREHTSRSTRAAALGGERLRSSSTPIDRCTDTEVVRSGHVEKYISMEKGYYQWGGRGGVARLPLTAVHTVCVISNQRVCQSGERDNYRRLKGK